MQNNKTLFVLWGLEFYYQWPAGTSDLKYGSVLTKGAESPLATKPGLSGALESLADPLRGSGTRLGVALAPARMNLLNFQPSSKEPRATFLPMAGVPLHGSLWLFTVSHCNHIVTATSG